MPYKNGNPSQRRRFNESKKDALYGLFEVLDEETLPERSRSGKYSMYTGEIEQYIDERFLPLQRNALLTVLREAGVPHDGSNRFVPGKIYSYKDQLKTLLSGYTGAAMLKLNKPAKEPEVDAAIEED